MSQSTSGRTCSVEGCDRPFDARGFCHLHYNRWRRHGDPLFINPKCQHLSLADRFHSRLIKTDGCWTVRVKTLSEGYARLWKDGKSYHAHRVAYELYKGPIPEGLTIDHLCRNRACVNPDHLEAVSIRENVLRGNSPSAVVYRTNLCSRGHEMTPENTLRQANGKRRCRTCTIEYERKRARERRRAEARALIATTPTDGAL